MQLAGGGRGLGGRGDEKCVWSSYPTQELARHITPHLTTNVYAKVRDERLAGLVEQVGEALVPAAKHVHNMHDAIRETDDVSVVGEDKDYAEGGI
jgi:hypothetical protein